MKYSIYKPIVGISNTSSYICRTSASCTSTSPSSKTAYIQPDTASRRTCICAPSYPSLTFKNPVLTIKYSIIIMNTIVGRQPQSTMKSLILPPSSASTCTASHAAAPGAGSIPCGQAPNARRQCAALNWSF